MIAPTTNNIAILVLAVLVTTGINVTAKNRAVPMTFNPLSYDQSPNIQASVDDIQYDPDNGTITLIKGTLYTPTKTIQASRRNRDKSLYNKIAIDFIHHYRHLFKLKQPADELIATRTQIDNLDYKHIRLQQVYKNIPVWNSEIIVHINNDEVVYLGGGHYIPTPDKISLKPAFSNQKALEYAVNLDPELKSDCSRCQAELVIYFDREIKPVLAYLIKSGSKYSGSLQLILDANTGKLLTRLPRIKT